MQPSKHHYSPLDQLSSRHQDEWQKTHTLQRRIIRILVFTNLLCAVALGISVFHSPVERKTEDYPPSDFAEVDDLPIKWTRFNWWTEYSGKNTTEVDALWDAILPSHGLVAVDHDWAVERKWPDSLALPTDKSKQIYLLEAYHLLHCVIIIRKTFWEAVNRQEYSYNPPHAGHCFDYLRQSIQCNADNTPLYSFGDYTAGNGQLRKCRDWNALRDWATDNTACYHDSVDAIPLNDQFGSCDDGSDGLREFGDNGERSHLHA